MKYVLYRAPKGIDRQIKQHELVAVEYGSDIDAVTPALIQAVADDLAGLPEYASSATAAYAPEPLQPFRRTTKYQYEMDGIVYPRVAKKNILVEYGIVEEADD